jgi:Fe-Mn family superoxide dismutase
MPYTLPDLDYAYDALEPYIDQRTMEIHHSKHHNTYVTKLNGALEGSGLEVPECPAALCAELGSIPEDKRTAVRNNGGGHANHAFFWKTIAPGGPAGPDELLAGMIDEAFGSLDKMKEAFAAAATGQFGSGWAWLCYCEDSEKLFITSTANQDNPWMPKSLTGTADGYPILGLDVWEHAYYLKYQNKRPDYVSAYWNVVNWEVAGAYLRKAKGECCGGGCGCHD